ncbi:GNAT family N-acetyltransferase [bacterium BMS3Abin03]|nr:GNAT family N-acetyltransferase [bacterium BMS3Abin03]
MKAKKIEINTSVFKIFPKLESKRLYFRRMNLSYAKDIHQIRSNNDVMKFMDVTRTKSVNDAKRLIRNVREDYKNEKGVSWAIIEKNLKSFIGYAGFWRMQPQHCRGEIGYALKPEYWGKGFMTEALKTIIDFGFHKMNLHSIEANVNPKNQKSKKLLKRLGFRKEAYFRENYLFEGKFLDSEIYSLLKKDLSRD